LEWTVNSSVYQSVAGLVVVAVCAALGGALLITATNTETIAASVKGSKRLIIVGLLLAFPSR
jgi:hypothetical protein